VGFLAVQNFAFAFQNVEGFQAFMLVWRVRSLAGANF
jgi:hypothetical protein